MSASSSSVNQGERRIIPNTKCGCGYERYERTSWTVDHPGRRFWNCPYSLVPMVKKCGYFRWKDLELFDPYYKDLIFPMRQEIDKLESGDAMRQCRCRIRELEQAVKHLEKQAAEDWKVAQGEKYVLEMDVLKLRTENGRLAKLLKINKIVVMLLVMCLGVTGGMLCFG